jgi:2-polyprenyl-6-methoxyphenol hydroxylase-like FAD-dependent oxidoreductase
MAEVGRILIVGGGIGGLSATTALHAHGFAPEVVERSPSWPTEGPGTTLHANGVRVLPPAVRNAALRERGDQLLRDRYRPLIPLP